MPWGDSTNARTAAQRGTAEYTVGRTMLNGVIERIGLAAGSVFVCSLASANNPPCLYKVEQGKPSSVSRPDRASEMQA